MLFEPEGAPAPVAMPNRTPRPQMTPGRAAVIALMNRYLVPGYDYRLLLLEIQKLAYFSLGQPLLELETASEPASAGGPEQIHAPTVVSQVQ